jgi:hypothetical protein
MFSNKRCLLVIVKKWHTQNFEFFFEQKFSKTQISKPGTLATYKLEICTWYNFVRIGVLYMTLSKFGILESL